MKNGKIRILLCALICLLLVMGCALAQAEEARKKVTVMVYMCGADLEQMNTNSATVCISKMYASRFNQEDVNVIVLCGGTHRWNSGLDASVLSLVDVGKGGRRSLHVAKELPQASMGDPETLTNFLQICYDEYPADAYDLVIWNHGGGSILGIIQDQNFQGDGLTTLEFEEALANSPFKDQKLDILAMHACLMGSAEFANRVAPYAKYYVASEDSQFGLEYSWLSGIESAAPLETAKKIVDTSFQYNVEGSAAKKEKTKTNAFAVIDLEKMEPLREAVDSFFNGFSAELTDVQFTAMSARRRDSQTFGLGESGGSSDYDLVDLGDLISHYQEYDPEKAAQVEQALSDAVVYLQAEENSSCGGLTVYHPYLNRKVMEGCLEVYKTLGFSENYYQYILRFAEKLNAEPIASYAGLDTESGPAQKAARTVYVLNLTEEQAAQYGSSSLKVLRKDGEDTYTFTFMGRNTALNDGTVSGEYVKNAVFPVNGAGEALSEAISYTVGENGEYIVPAKLIHHETEDTQEVEHQALITFFAEDGKLTPGSVRVLDEVAGRYTSIYATTLADYDEIELTFVSRKETRNDQGTLLSFDEWEAADTRVWRQALDGSWSFALLEESLDETTLYVTFEVQDSQNNLYSSSLLQVQDAPIPIQLDYDDLNLILVNRPVLSETGDGVIFSFAVTNMTETESIIALENLTVNGAALDLTQEAYGTGENWGLLKDEEQNLSILIPADGIPGGPLRELTFDLKLKDAVSGEEIGTVPVKVAFRTEA